MADLMAIGYDDETTAHQAAEEVHRIADDLGIPPDAAAVIVRDGEGGYQLTTNHHTAEAGASWGMLWGPLFKALFFIPDTREELSVRVRDMVKPGTSCLLLIVEKVTPEVAVEGLRQYGGRVLRLSLSDDTQDELRGALHEVPAGALGGLAGAG